MRMPSPLGPPGADQPVCTSWATRPASTSPQIRAGSDTLTEPARARRVEDRIAVCHKMVDAARLSIDEVRRRTGVQANESCDGDNSDDPEEEEDMAKEPILQRVSGLRWPG